MHIDVSNFILQKHERGKEDRVTGDSELHLWGWGIIKAKHATARIRQDK